jgi:hypothetical protein
MGFPFSGYEVADAGGLIIHDRPHSDDERSNDLEATPPSPPRSDPGRYGLDDEKETLEDGIISKVGLKDGLKCVDIHLNLLEEGGLVDSKIEPVPDQLFEGK